MGEGWFYNDTAPTALDVSVQQIANEAAELPVTSLRCRQTKSNVPEIHVEQFHNRILEVALLLDVALNIAKISLVFPIKPNYPSKKFFIKP